MGKLKRKEKHEAELSQLEKDIDARSRRSMMIFAVSIEVQL